MLDKLKKDTDILLFFSFTLIIITLIALILSIVFFDKNEPECKDKRMVLTPVYINNHIHNIPIWHCNDDKD